MAGSAGGNVIGTDMIVGVLLDPGQDAVDYNFCEVLPASISTVRATPARFGR